MFARKPLIRVVESCKKVIGVGLSVSQMVSGVVAAGVGVAWYYCCLAGRARLTLPTRLTAALSLLPLDYLIKPTLTGHTLLNIIPVYGTKCGNYIKPQYYTEYHVDLILITTFLYTQATILNNHSYVSHWVLLQSRDHFTM